MAKTLLYHAVTIRYDEYKAIIRHTAVGAHISINGCAWPLNFFAMENVATYFVAGGNIKKGYDNCLVTIVQWQIQQN